MSMPMMTLSRAFDQIRTLHPTINNDDIRQLKLYRNHGPLAPGCIARRPRVSCNDATGGGPAGGCNALANATTATSFRLGAYQVRRDHRRGRSDHFKSRLDPCSSMRKAQAPAGFTVLHGRPFTHFLRFRTERPVQRSMTDRSKERCDVG